MNKQEDVELLPCPLPFCNGEAAINNDDDGTYVFCTKCDTVIGYGRSDTVDRAVSIWNARPTPAVDNCKTELKEFVIARGGVLTPEAQAMIKRTSVANAVEKDVLTMGQKSYLESARKFVLDVEHESGSHSREQRAEALKKKDFIGIIDSLLSKHLPKPIALTEEQEEELQEIIDEHTEKQNISPETKTFKQRDFLLKLIAQFKNQPSQDQQLIEVLCSDLQDAQEKIDRRDGVDVEELAEKASTISVFGEYPLSKINQPKNFPQQKLALMQRQQEIKKIILSTYESMSEGTRTNFPYLDVEKLADKVKAMAIEIENANPEEDMFNSEIIKPLIMEAAESMKGEG